jgi:drug/metabolite transporter (DMT)-like permease
MTGGTASAAEYGFGAGQRAPERAPEREDGLPGVLVAGITALISGLSVFVNSYGVHAVKSPAVYTTAKNLVATAILAGFTLCVWQNRRRWPKTAATRFVVVEDDAGSGGSREPARWAVLRWLALAYVGIVGGGLAFVLFFDGLADTTATPAAFWRDTLVIWVAVLAIPFLHERLTWWNGTAIGLLVVGEVAVAGGTGHLAASRGEILVLSASLLWAVEVVVAKILLREVAPAAVSLIRMGVGALALVGYLAASGSLHTLLSLDAAQVGWALLTGLLLSAYVATWMTALARGRALDVTSILVGGALVTALLEAAAGTTSLAPGALGLALIAIGTGTVVWMGLRHPSALRGEGVTA